MSGTTRTKSRRSGELSHIGEWDFAVLRGRFSVRDAFRIMNVSQPDYWSRL